MSRKCPGARMGPSGKKRRSKLCGHGGGTRVIRGTRASSFKAALAIARPSTIDVRGMGRRNPIKRWRERSWGPRGSPTPLKSPAAILWPPAPHAGRPSGHRPSGLRCAIATKSRLPDARQSPWEARGCAFTTLQSAPPPRASARASRSAASARPSTIDHRRTSLGRRCENAARPFAIFSRRILRRAR